MYDEYKITMKTVPIYSHTLSSALISFHFIAFEKQELQRRQQEQSRNHLLSFVKEQKLHDTLNKSQEQLEQRIANRKTNLEEGNQRLQVEAEAVRKQHELANQAAIQTRLAIQRAEGAEIASNQAELKHKALVQDNRELREFKSLVEAGETRAIRNHQLHQQAEDESTRQLLTWAQDQSALLKAKEAEVKKKIDQIHNDIKTLDTRQALRSQIESHAALRLAARREAAEEVLSIQHLSQLAEEEESIKKTATLQTKSQLIKDQQKLVEEQAQLKKAKKLAESEEDRRMLEYWQAKRKAEAAAAVQRVTKQTHQDEKHELLCQVAIQEAMNREEEEALLHLLHAEMEVQRAQRALEEHELRRRVAQQDIMAVNLHLAQQRKLDTERELEEEKAFKQKLLDHLAEQENVDRMKTAQRRAAQIEHLRMAIDAVMHRRRLKEEISKEEAKLEADIKARQVEKDGAVSKEMHRLLMHAMF